MFAVCICKKLEVKSVKSSKPSWFLHIFTENQGWARVCGWVCWGIYSEIKRRPCAPCQMSPPQPRQGSLVAQCSLGPEASSGLVPVYHSNSSKLGWSKESGTKEVPGWEVPGPGLYTAAPWRGSVVSLLHMRRPMYRGQETSSETQPSAHVTGLHVLCPWRPLPQLLARVLDHMSLGGMSQWRGEPAVY